MQIRYPACSLARGSVTTGRYAVTEFISRISLPLLAASTAALIGSTAANAQAQVAAKAPPDFSTGNAGWVTVGTDWIALPGSPPPVSFDPAHPYVGNNTGKQPTFRVADINNSNLTQFAKDALKKANDEVLRGKAMYARESRCWATGVPAFLLNPGGPTYWLQTPQKITMIWQMDHQVRHVYLNVAHSPDPKPSWYGESVGHYEGDTLVVDTIGQNTQTFVDNYRTPHTEQLHVIERFHMIEGGRKLQVDIHVEDPGAFTTSWDAIQRFARNHPNPRPSVADNKANGTLNE